MDASSDGSSADVVSIEGDSLPSEREMQLALSRAVAEQAGRLLASIQDACRSIGEGKRVVPRPHIAAW